MAFSRAEIELLITARNKGHQAFRELSADMAEAQRAVERANVALDHQQVSADRASAGAVTLARETTKVSEAVRKAEADFAAADRAMKDGKAASQEWGRSLVALEQAKIADAAASRTQTVATKDATQAQGDSAKATGKATAGTTLLTKATSLLVSAMAIERIVGFTVATIRQGTEIQSNAKAAGISAQAYQQLTGVIEDTGGRAGSLDRALAQMTNQLMRGGTGTVAAVGALDLSLADLQAQRPDEAFLSLADAVRQIEDPLKRNRIAHELWGEASREITPAILADLRRTKDEIATLSDDQVAALAEADRAWARWRRNEKVAVGEVIGDIARLVSALQRLRGVSSVVGGAQSVIQQTLRSTPVGLAASLLDEGVSGQWQQWTAERDAQWNLAFLGGKTAGPSVPQLSEGPGLAAGQPFLAQTLDDLLQIEVAAPRAARALGTVKRQAEGPLAPGSFLASVGASIGANQHLRDTTSVYARTGIAGAIQPGYGDILANRASTGLGLVGLQQSVRGATMRDLLGGVGGVEDVPSYWRTQVLPEMTRAVALTQQAVMGGFAQMLLGAKSFGGSWIDIWRSIQGGTIQIIGSLMASITQSLFRGLLGTMRGQSGAWSQAFAGMGSLGLRSGGSAASVPAGAMRMTGNAAGMGGLGAGGGGVSAATLSGLAGAAGGALGGGLIGYGTGSTAKGMLVGAATGAGSAIATGALMGSAAGPAGIAIGAGVGLVAGYIGAALKQRKQRTDDKSADKELAALQQELLDEYGSMDRITEIGASVGVDLASAWGHRKRDGLVAFERELKVFEERQALLNQSMEAYGLTWEDLGEKARATKINDLMTGLLAGSEALKLAGVDGAKVMTGQAGAYNELLVALLRTGDQVPPTLVPILTQLERMGLLTETNRRALLGLAEATTVDFRGMQEAAQKYGIDLTALGTQFHGARISADAQQIFRDFDLLTKAGADVGGVLFGMREEISKVVAESLKFGTEIPENMRPLVAELARSGHLLDEHGEKITDLSKLKFAQPLEEGFDKVVEAIERLGKVLTDQLPKDAATAREKLQAALTSGEFDPIRVPYEFVPTNSPGSGGGGSLDVPGAAHGIYATGPTMRVFAEKEPELGGPVSFMTKALAGAMAQVGQSDGSAPSIALSFSIGGDAARDIVALKDTIRRDIVPEIIRAVSGNIAGARTNMRLALGVR